LGKAAVGQYASDIVFTLLGLELVRRLEILIPLAMYVGILLTLARWYRDNEMTVLSACGIGLGSISRAVMALALGFALLVALFSLYLSPIATARMEQVKNESKTRTDILVAPGVFTELRGSGRILYAEKIGRDGELNRIFVNDHQAQRQNVLVAETARQSVDPDTGERFLMLHNGSIYEGIPGKPDYRIVEFGRYTLRLEPPKLDAAPRDIDARPTVQLLYSTNHRYAAQLHWRLAKPLSVLVLAMFALVLAHTDPRRGRATNLIGAILIYFIYTNLLGIGEGLIKDQRLPPGLGLWWVHTLLAVIAGYLLTRRMQDKPLLPKLMPGSRSS
ncbi:MAG: LPS export ABC transporter permease LptF, partial [Acidiferrobacterales bacterium]